MRALKPTPLKIIASHTYPLHYYHRRQLSSTQVTNVLLKLPMISVKWRLKHASCEHEHYMCGMPKNLRERKWIGISAASEDECIIQVELTRSCIENRKVCVVTMTLTHDSCLCCMYIVLSSSIEQLHLMSFCHPEVH